MDRVRRLANRNRRNQSLRSNKDLSSDPISEASMSDARQPPPSSQYARSRRSPTSSVSPETMQDILPETNPRHEPPERSVRLGEEPAEQPTSTEFVARYKNKKVSPSKIYGKMKQLECIALKQEVTTLDHQLRFAHRERDRARAEAKRAKKVNRLLIMALNVYSRV